MSGSVEVLDVGLAQQRWYAACIRDLISLRKCYFPASKTLGSLHFPSFIVSMATVIGHP